MLINLKNIKELINTDTDFLILRKVDKRL